MSDYTRVIVLSVGGGTFIKVFLHNSFSTNVFIDYNSLCGCNKVF